MAKNTKKLFRNPPENPNNVELTCEDCSKRQYPSKGKFTRKMLKYAKYVKAAFGNEHMWVKIRHLDEDCVTGTVANVPVLPKSPNYGEIVTIRYSDIEDAN